ncbi:hypothetical protein N234_21125 [Ralstonia pickettii DTP0602]|nr:hypothetical protein N234_21125 [Ralstonia pickettii DTP0602]
MRLASAWLALRWKRCGCGAGAVRVRCECERWNARVNGMKLALPAVPIGKLPRVLEGGAMPVMLIVLALQFLQGLSPPAAALFALPQEMPPADAAAVVETALTR